MLWLGGQARTLTEGAARIRASLQDGTAMAKFKEVVAAQHGDPSALDDPDKLPTAPHKHLFTASRDGFITSMDSEAMGMAAVDLGAGRARAEDPVDPAVGFRVLRKTAERVAAGEPIVEVKHRDGRGLDSCLKRLQAAIVIGDTRPQRPPLVAERLGDALAAGDMVPASGA